MLISKWVLLDIRLYDDFWHVIDLSRTIYNGPQEFRLWSSYGM